MDDGAPAAEPIIRLLVEVNRTQDGRLEGRMRTDGSTAWSSFSGVLELLKVLEDHT
jgi:hypothetical protein